MSNPLNALLRPPPEQGADYRWGYVTDDDPFEVTLDTETTPIPTPSTLVAVETGDRVFVLLESTRATVIGKVPEAPVAPTTTTTTTVAPTLRLRAGQFSTTATSALKTGSVSFGVTFGAAPRVFCQFANDTEETFCYVTSVSTTSFDYAIRRVSTFSETFAVNWLAIPDGSLTL